MDETPWLTDRELAAWKQFVAVVELLPGVIDTQLQRDADLSHFEYYVLAMLSEAPEKTLRMSQLADVTNATPPRLSHVVNRLERRGFVQRNPRPDDKRATDAVLTDAGWHKVVEAAPGHVRNVRHHVIDRLTPEQVDQLGAISAALLRDPQG